MVVRKTDIHYRTSSKRIDVINCILNWMYVNYPVLSSCGIVEENLNNYKQDIHKVYRQNALQILMHFNTMTPSLNQYARMKLKVINLKSEEDLKFYQDMNTLVNNIRSMWFKKPEKVYQKWYDSHSSSIINDLLS